MVFNSLQFVAFFLVVYALYRLLPHRAQNVMLVAASYYFYAAWDWRFLGLLIGSTVVDFFVGRYLGAAIVPRRRRLALVLSLAFNLGMLGFFKYFNFFASSLAAVFDTLGWHLDPVTVNVILPIGISFYTFMTISYVIDVYRRDIQPTANFIDFALFVSYFPHLVAGPILRASLLLPQIARPRTISRDQVVEGLWLAGWGYFQKMFVADNLANLVTAVFGPGASPTGLDVLVAMYAFAFQIYGDFAGYSNIARGISKLMGIELNVNFLFPYFVVSPQEFWRNWHISLSTWLRDYLYIPLGGSRGTEVRTYVNLMLTMLLGGLWHGASWTFVVWGGLHGLYLAVERWLRERTGVAGDPASGWSRLALALATYALVNVTWVFFRAEDFGGAARILAGMAGLAAEAAPILPTLFVAKVVVIVVAIVATQWLMRNRSLEDVVARTPWWVTGLVAAAMLFAVTITQGSGQAFIYFQF